MKTNFERVREDIISAIKDGFIEWEDVVRVLLPYLSDAELEEVIDVNEWAIELDDNELNNLEDNDDDSDYDDLDIAKLMSESFGLKESLNLDNINLTTGEGLLDTVTVLNYNDKPVSVDLYVADPVGPVNEVSGGDGYSDRITINLDLEEGFELPSNTEINVLGYTIKGSIGVPLGVVLSDVAFGIEQDDEYTGYYPDHGTCRTVSFGYLESYCLDTLYMYPEECIKDCWGHTCPSLDCEIIENETGKKINWDNKINGYDDEKFNSRDFQKKLEVAIFYDFVTRKELFSKFIKWINDYIERNIDDYFSLDNDYRDYDESVDSKKIDTEINLDEASQKGVNNNIITVVAEDTWSAYKDLSEEEILNMVDLRNIKSCGLNAELIEHNGNTIKVKFTGTQAAFDEVKKHGYFLKAE